MHSKPCEKLALCVILAFVHAIPAVIATFCLMLLGYGGKKLRVLKPQDSQTITAVVTNFTGPAFAFSYIYGKVFTGHMAIAPVGLFVAEMIILGAVYLVAKAMNLNKRTTGGLMMAAVFGNTGFLGYPITMAAFPQNSQAIATAVIVDQFGMTIPLFSIGIAIAAGFGSGKVDRWQWLSFAKTPLFISVVMALILRGVPLPKFLTETINMLGAATIPMAMISLGLSASASSMKAIKAPFAVAFLAKMVAMPLLVYIITSMLGIHGVVQKATILEAAMPTAVMAGVLSTRYGANGPFVSGSAILMTISSVITIPVVVTMLGYIK